MIQQLKKLQGDKSLHRFALDIGFSEMTLRNFYLGKPLFKWNLEKIERYINDRNKTIS